MLTLFVLSAYTSNSKLVASRAMFCIAGPLLGMATYSSKVSDRWPRVKSRLKYTNLGLVVSGVIVVACITVATSLRFPDISAMESLASTKVHALVG